MSTQYLKIKFLTQPKYTRKIFDIVGGLLDAFLTNKAAYREFMVALGEAIDNAIMHGNHLNSEKYIDVECEISPEKIVCHIADEGPGFKYDKYMKDELRNFAPEALMKKVAKYGTPGSMGIAMMRKCLNEVFYNEQGTRLTLVKKL
ncbi:MAG: ATP-binding protein [Planctomycetota bacterium]